MERTRVRVRVRGRVQGVFFRASTRTRAAELGLVGWVRNEANGDVVLEAEGPADAVNALIAWCRRGPELARVDGVAVEPLTVLDDERGFAVHHGAGS